MKATLNKEAVKKLYSKDPNYTKNQFNKMIKLIRQDPENDNLPALKALMKFSRELDLYFKTELNIK